MRIQSAMMTLSILVLAACSQNTGNHLSSNSSDVTTQQSAGIYGGEEVQSHDPINQSIVGIFSKSEGYLCTGSLVSNDLVITAAHCIEGDPKQIVILFGDEVLTSKFLIFTDVSSSAVIRKAVDAKANPAFDINHMKPTGMSDVGIIRFTGGIPAGYKPATLLVNYDKYVQNGSPAVMSGYGISSRFGNSGSGTLRKVTLEVEDAHLSPNETLIKADTDKGICSGDSGGPAYLESNGKLALWGITSRAGNGYIFGFVKMNCVAGSVFTRVDEFWSWFQSAAKAMGSSLPDYPTAQN